tara:strand:+ start:2997 stop:4133 length:1137 start_codon:yes stop_codon:yes gene_type:complete
MKGLHFMRMITETYDAVIFDTIAVAENGWAIDILDQTFLPHDHVIKRLTNATEGGEAISAMRVRGAPLIGVTAAYTMALAMKENAGDKNLRCAAEILRNSRPTAVNLAWAVDQMLKLLLPLEPGVRCKAAYQRANEMAGKDIATNLAIGEHGLTILEKIKKKKKGECEPINVLTHCNAGALATVGWGTATAPIYLAHRRGINLHVWVDETRPRNQGASLTAWELSRNKVPHTVISDNVGGHLMQNGKVDVCITGSDRTTLNGDVANKIGTYLKALAAHDNGIPFFVALPSSTIDCKITDGVKGIPIEKRQSEEVAWISGKTESGKIERVCIVPEGTPVENYAFDVTPAKFITGLITERGITEASYAGLTALFPEYKRQ